MNNQKLERQQAQNRIKKLYDNDPFSQWMGIEILEIKEGYSSLKMRVRKEMLNGFEICHGGIIYALADSAFAFASNSHDRIALALDVNMSYIKKVYCDDILYATTSEIHHGYKTGLYIVNIINQKKEDIAIFRGTVYRSSERIT